MNDIIKVDTEIATVNNTFDRLKEEILARLTPHTKRAYDRALTDYTTYVLTNGLALDFSSVNSHIDELYTNGVGETSINLRLAAIKKLAHHAYMKNWINADTYTRIRQVKGIKIQGQKLGNWLSKEQVEAAINGIDTTTNSGMRDRAMLAVLLGAGLRRSEVTDLKTEQLQQREGRWVIVDIVGKGNKTRSVPIASWVAYLLQEWIALGYSSHYVFPAINKGDRVIKGDKLSEQSIYVVVSKHLPGIAPHDLRRTFAQLARKGNAPIEQISLVMGHSSVATTERYLGTRLNLQESPSDAIRVDIKR